MRQITRSLSLTAIFLLLSCSLFLASCSFFKSTADTVREAIGNMYDVKSSQFAATPQFTLRSPIGDSKIDLKVAGKYDKTETQNYKLDLSLVAEGNVKSPEVDGHAKIDLNLMIADLKLYLKINELAVPDDIKPIMPIYQPILDKYLKQWIVFSPEFFTAEDEQQLIKNFTQEDPAAIEFRTKISQLIKETYFFDVTADQGTTNLNGVEVHTYDVELNRQNLLVFLQAFSKILAERKNSSTMNNSGSEETSSGLSEFFNNLRVSGKLFIGVADNLIYQSDLVFAQQIPDSGFDAKLIFNGSSDNFNQKQNFTPPTGAIDFPQFMADLEKAVPTTSAQPNTSNIESLMPSLEDTEMRTPSTAEELEKLRNELKNIPELNIAVPQFESDLKTE